MRTRLVLGMCLSAVLAHASILFDTGIGNTTGLHGAGFGVGEGVSVTGTVQVTQIGFYMDMPSGGNVKFMIWNSTNSTLLFSQTKSFGTSGPVGLFLSDPFSFTLVGGNTYYFAVVGDNNRTDSFFSPTTPGTTQNGITLVNPSTFYTGFASPTFAGTGGTTEAFQLQSSTLPEPASFLAVAAGLGLLGLRLRRRRTATS